MPTTIYPIEVVRGDRHLPGNAASAMTFTFQAPPQPDASTFGAKVMYIHSITGGYCVNVPAYATTPGRLVGVMLSLASVSNTNNGTAQILCPTDGGGFSNASTTVAAVVGSTINQSFGYPGLKMQRTNDNTYTMTIDIVYVAGTGALVGAWEFNPTTTLKLGGTAWSSSAASGIAISYSFGTV